MKRDNSNALTVTLTALLLLGGSACSREKGNSGVSDEELHQLKDDAAKTPNDPNAWYKLGSAYKKAKKWDDSVSAFQRALELEPGLVKARFRLGHVYRSQARIDEARKQFARVIEDDPEHYMAYISLGALDESLREYGRAVDSFKKATKIEPRRPEAYVNLAHAYGALGDAQEALRYAVIGADVGPEDPLAQYNAGIAHRNTGDNEGAIKALRRAIELRPKYTNAQYALGYLLLRAGDSDGARHCASALETLDSDKAAELRSHATALDNWIANAMTLRSSDLPPGMEHVNDWARDDYSLPMGLIVVARLELMGPSAIPALEKFIRLGKARLSALGRVSPSMAFRPNTPDSYERMLDEIGDVRYLLQQAGQALRAARQAASNDGD